MILKSSSLISLSVFYEKGLEKHCKKKSIIIKLQKKEVLMLVLLQFLYSNQCQEDVNMKYPVYLQCQEFSLSIIKGCLQLKCQDVEYEVSSLPPLSRMKLSTIRDGC